MGLFDKKFCDICGEKIGLLGNRKLDDGNCCKDCAKNLSPWMTDRRRSTIEDIKQHLAYREENKSKFQQFNPINVVGDNWKVMVDPNMGAFIVTRSKNWQAENPDVIPLSQVVSCEIERKEHRQEVYQTSSDGSKRSFYPPRYDYSYDFKVCIRVNSPWFNEIEFKLNTFAIDRYAHEYHKCETEGDQIRSLLLSGNMGGMAGGYQQQPVQPQYQQPGQPQYQQPMQSQYQQPMQPQYQQQPAQPQYQQPMQSQYQQQPGPAQSQAAPASPPQVSAAWLCGACGATNESGKFCQSCGSAKG